MVSTNLPNYVNVRYGECHSTPVAYRIFGKGPRILLLHGWLHSSRRWIHIARELSKNYTCVVPDIPGCGSSQPLPVLQQNFKNVADVIADFNRTINGNTPLHGIIAHSMGARLICRCLTQDNVETDKLVLVGAPVDGLPRVTRKLLFPGFLTVTTGLMHVLSFSLAARYLRLLTRITIGRWTKVDQKLILDHRDADPISSEVYFRELSHPANSKHSLESCRALDKIKALIIRGDHDPYVRSESLKHLAEKLNCEYLEIENSGHTPMFSNPEQFLTAVKSFFAE